MKGTRQLALVFLFLGPPIMASPAKQHTILAQSPNVAMKYDVAKNETTVRLARMKLSGENGKYHSLHSAVSFRYPGQTRRIPEVLSFELQTVVKDRRLKVDLYVQLLVDGKKIFLSSNRLAERNPVPGKPWVSEHIVLHMPYEVFVKITKAKDFAIQVDQVKFIVGETQLQQLRDFGDYITGN